MVVNKLGTVVTWNQPTILRAHFTTDVGMFRFDAPGDSQSYYGSQRVQVTRLSATTWDVSTNYYSDGTLTAGDLAWLNAGGTPLGLYHMPFGATVECLNGPWPNCPKIARTETSPASGSGLQAPLRASGFGSAEADHYRRELPWGNRRASAC